RPSSRTASMISRLMSHPLLDQIAPHDGVVRDLVRVPFGLHADSGQARDNKLSLEALESLDFFEREDGNAWPARPLEVSGCAQRALDARGRHIHRVVAKVRT